MRHAQLKQIYIIVISRAAARSFGETERRLVIYIDFTVALALGVGAVRDGDVLV